MGKIAVVFGGNSLEHDISIVTAFFVMEECIKHNIDYLPLYLSRKGVFYTGKALLNKDNYDNLKGFKQGVFKHKAGYNAFFVGRKKFIIDCALLCVHGANVEDGTLGAFFDILKIPNTSSGVFNASLLQNKHMSKILLKSLKIPVVKHILLTNPNDTENKNFTFPVIVKPVHLGSSIGVKRVDDSETLKSAIADAFSFDDSVLLEDIVNNLKEVNIAVLGNEDFLELSAIEEVNNQDRVLSFEDKYQQFHGKQSEHIIPAVLDEKLKEKIEEYTKRAFISLGCSGVMRFDYLIDEKTQKVYLNEINTIPGSLAFYLFDKVGISFIKIIERLVEIAQINYQKKHQRISSYKLSDLKSIGRKK